MAGNIVWQKDKRGSITLYAFDGNSRLTEQRTPLEKDASGNPLYAVKTYGYDAAGQVISVRLSGTGDSSFVRETVNGYYDNGLLKSVSDNGGGYALSEYDMNGNLTKQATLRDNSVYDVEKYEYDSQNRMVKQIRLVQADRIADAGALAMLADPDYTGYVQSATGYEYDILGNRTKEIDPRAYAFAETDTANRDKYTVKYEYDALNRLKRVNRVAGDKAVYSEFTYDASGNKISERSERGYTTLYAYDKRNRLLSVTDPLGSKAAFTYDLGGNKLSETNAAGSTMTYAYDKLNRLVTVTDAYGKIVTRYVYDAAGNTVKKIDAKGYLSASSDDERYGTVYTYDLNNRLVTETDPELAQSKGKYSHQYRYNPAGEKTSDTDALGHMTTYAYDAAGYLTKVTQANGDSVSYGYDLAGNNLFMTDGRGKTTEYEYGDFGLMRSMTDASGRMMSYQYDLVSNLVQMKDRNGSTATYEYDNRNLLVGKSVEETVDSIRYAYDEAGNRAAMQDESGASQFAYDGNNRLTSVTKDGAVTLRYTYDKVGNVASVTDRLSYTTTYAYDKSSRMSTVTASGKTTAYRYDENGNRLSITYEGGVAETYVYNKTDKLLKVTNKKADGSIISYYEYAYDAAGNPESKTDSYGTTNYAYDALGRIAKIEAPGKTTAYTYDKAGNRLTLNETYTSDQMSGYTDPDTKQELTYRVKKSDYVYGKSNELMQLKERMLDGNSQQLLEKTTTYLYDNNGNEIRQKVAYLRPHDRTMHQVTGGSAQGDSVEGDPNTIIEKVANSYDGFNRLKRAERVKAGMRTTTEFVYDGDDLRTSKTVRSSTDGYTPMVTEYLYDRQYVILETDGSDKLSVRYVRGINYIARIDASDKLSYYLYNGHGDVMQTVSSSGEVENQYDYDVFGNMTLTIEVYAQSIRYAGEFYDTETGLYYLRARYYDPYVGRFITEDTYRGESEDPLSLNLYTYVLNNPLIYWDPTGHWEQGDKDLNVEAQAKIIALTSAYYNATSKQEKAAISAQAKAIRDDKASKDKTVVTPLEFQSDAIKSAVSKGNYMTAAQWKEAIKKDGIVSKITASYGNMSGTSMTTTTTIGRTNLAVSSSYSYSINQKTQIAMETFKASISISYNVTTNEAKFIASLAANTDYSLEQALVALDLLIENKGKVTNKELNDYGVTASSNLWGMDSTNNYLMEAYDFSLKGLTMAEASEAYQKQQAEIIARGFDIATAAVVAGGGFKFSNRVKDSVEAKTTRDVSTNAVGADRARKTTSLDEATLYKTSNGKIIMQIGDGKKSYTLTQSQVDELKAIKDLDKRWSGGSFGNSTESLVEHYFKHKGEVSATSITQYMNKATEFSKNLRGATKSNVSGAVEGVVRYKKNGKYIDLAPDGSIVSFGKS